LKKKILSINVGLSGSTGKIMRQISQIAEESGFKTYMAYGRGLNNFGVKAIKIGNKLDVYYHGLVTRITGKHGFSSKRATRKFLNKVDKLNPDLIHLHNIHGYYINIDLLFNYIKEKSVPVVWTLHDCWPFTGHCTHFDYVGCNKWISGCYDCPQININTYPKSFLIDSSKKNYEKKKKLFCGVKNLKIITPSLWLKDLVEKSFLNDYEVTVINNGVDINTFKPVKVNKSEFGINEDKFVILGVASKFSLRKGLKYFIELSRMISDDTLIFLVGLNENQIKNLPKSVIGIKRTEDVEQLVRIYSMADVFINPTLEDNFPTTNLEALACGTPVITFNTGGSPETVDTNTGIVVEKGDTKALHKAIQIIKNQNTFTARKCRERVVRNFSADEKFREYVKLYKEILRT